jgi:hypothetical protein
VGEGKEGGGSWHATGCLPCPCAAAADACEAALCAAYPAAKAERDGPQVQHRGASPPTAVARPLPALPLRSPRGSAPARAPPGVGCPRSRTRSRCSRRHLCVCGGWWGVCAGEAAARRGAAASGGGSSGGGGAGPPTHPAAPRRGARRAGHPCRRPGCSHATREWPRAPHHSASCMETREALGAGWGASAACGRGLAGRGAGQEGREAKKAIRGGESRPLGTAPSFAALGGSSPSWRAAACWGPR